MIVKAKLELSTTEYHATHTIADTGKQWVGDIIDISPLQRSIGAEKSYAVSAITIKFNDSKGAWRTRMTGTGQYILRKTVSLYDVSDNLLFSGAIDSWDFELDAFVITVMDRLLGLQALLSVDTINKVTYPDAVDGAVGVSMPIIAGYANTTWGAIKAWRTSTGKFLVADHHVKSIEKVFDADKAEIASGWTLDNNADGHAYLSYAGTDDYYNVNVKGLKDGSDVLIEDPIDALTRILTDYSDMAFNAASLATAKVLMAARSYVVGGAITAPTQLGEFLTMFCTTFDCDFYISRSREIYLTMLDWESLPVAKQYNEYQIKNFESSVDPQVVRNKIKYMYRYCFAEDYFQYMPIYNKAASVTHWGEFYGTLDLRLTGDATTAEDVVQRYSVMRKNPSRIAENVEIPLGLLGTLELGQIVNLRHPAAIRNEYVKYQVTAIEERYLEDVAVLTCVDISTLREYSTFVLGDRDTMHTTWITATPAEKLYGYLADKDSGLFSDGAQGKSV